MLPVHSTVRHFAAGNIRRDSRREDVAPRADALHEGSD